MGGFAADTHYNSTEFSKVIYAFKIKGENMLEPWLEVIRSFFCLGDRSARRVSWGACETNH